MRSVLKLLLLVLAMLAVRMAGRALKRDAEVMAALWTLLTMTALAGTNVSVKAKSTEQRLNSLVPVVFPNTGGTITGSVTVNGNHSVGGQLTVNGGSGSAQVAVSGSGHFTGTLQADSQVSTGNVNSTGGSTNEFSGGIHTAGGMVVDGSLSAGNLRPGQGGGTGIFPIADGTPWENQIIDGLNNLVSALRNSGIVT